MTCSTLPGRQARTPTTVGLTLRYRRVGVLGGHGEAGRLILGNLRDAMLCHAVPGRAVLWRGVAWRGVA